MTISAILKNVSQHIQDTGTCRSEKQHQEECWWLALEATKLHGDNAEHPTVEHRARAARYQRETCARRGEA